MLGPNFIQRMTRVDSTTWHKSMIGVLKIKAEKQIYFCPKYAEKKKGPWYLVLQKSIVIGVVREQGRQTRRRNKWKKEKKKEFIMNEWITEVSGHYANWIASLMPSSPPQRQTRKNYLVSGGRHIRVNFEQGNDRCEKPTRIVGNYYQETKQ